MGASEPAEPSASLHDGGFGDEPGDVVESSSRDASPTSATSTDGTCQRVLHRPQGRVGDEPDQPPSSPRLEGEEDFEDYCMCESAAGLRAADTNAVL